jgi:hypothetical protein
MSRIVIVGWQPYRHLWADCLDNVGSLTSHNPIGLHGLLQGIALLFFTIFSRECYMILLFILLGPHVTCFTWPCNSFPARRPWFEPRSGYVGFVWAKWNSNKFSPSTTVSPVTYFTDCFALVHPQGRYNRPNVANVQSGFTVPHKKLKKKILK